MVDFKTKSFGDIRDGMSRRYITGMQQLGYLDTRITTSDPLFLEFSAIASLIAYSNENTAAQAAAAMIDTASDKDLDKRGALFRIPRGEPAKARGAIEYLCSTANLVSEGAQLQDDNGNTFLVLTGGVRARGDLIEVQAQRAGEGGNIAEGTRLKWTSPPLYSELYAYAVSDFAGGGDAQKDDDYRNTITSVLRDRPATGNPSHIIKLSTETYPNTNAFVYPCFNGPGTLGIAIAKNASAKNKSREMNSDIMTSIIEPGIKAKLPAFIETEITTVEDVPCDVSMGISIPKNYWQDANPLPTPVEELKYVPVTGVDTQTRFTIQCLKAPQAGITHVSFWNSTLLTLFTALVVAVRNVDPELYEIDLDQPFSGVEVGDYIYPTPKNGQNYINALLKFFANAGPGEKVSTPQLAERAKRYPPIEEIQSPLINPSVKFLVDAGPEVLDAQILAASETVETPSNLHSPPQILIPRKMAFYKL